MHPGRGPGLTDRRLGQRGGVETVTLSEAQLPQHNHNLQATSTPATLNGPGNTRTLARSAGGFAYHAVGSNLTNLNQQALQPASGIQEHENRMPFLTLNFIIALVGLYPSRS